MKILSDALLKKILGQRFNSMEPLPSDHLWGGIEQSLPAANTSGWFMSFVKIATLIGGVLALLVSDVSHIEAATDASRLEIEAPTDDRNPLISTEKSESTEKTIKLREVETKEWVSNGIEASDRVEKRNSSIHGRTIKVLKDDKTPVRISENKIINGSNSTLEFSNAASDSTANIDVNNVDFFTKKTFSVIPNADLISLTDDFAPKVLLITNSRSELVHPSAIRDFKEDRTWFLSGSGFVTYHSLIPSTLDEYYISSDPERVPSLADRSGFSFGFGFTKSIRSRFEYSLSANLLHQRATFYFLVANDLEPEYSLLANRLDMDLKAGLSYEIHGLTGNERIGMNLGVRRQLLSTNNQGLNYPGQILHWEISYSKRWKLTEIGPYFGTFLTGMEYDGIGQIRPSIYGIRLNIRLLGQ